MTLVKQNVKWCNRNNIDSTMKPTWLWILTLRVFQSVILDRSLKLTKPQFLRLQNRNCATVGNNEKTRATCFQLNMFFLISFMWPFSDHWLKLLHCPRHWATGLEHLWSLNSYPITTRKWRPPSHRWETAGLRLDLTYSSLRSWVGSNYLEPQFLHL